MITIPGAQSVTDQAGVARRIEEAGPPAGAAEEERRRPRCSLRRARSRTSSLSMRGRSAGADDTNVRPESGGPLSDPAGSRWSQVGRPRRRSTQIFLLAGALTLAAALLAGYLVAGRDRGAAAADGADHRGRGCRQASTAWAKAQDEVRRLAESFDHMLDRLEDAFARQRGFVSDASHELRTPLTAIRGRVRGPGARPIHRRSGASTKLAVSREVERMDRLVDDLLTLARIDEEGG